MRQAEILAVCENSCDFCFAKRLLIGKVSAKFSPDQMPDPLKKKDVRWRQRFQNYRKAFSQLSNAAALAKRRELTELEQQGLIQAFEFTHELAWNTLKDFLAARRGPTARIYGSRDATREAFAA